MKTATPPQIDDKTLSARIDRVLEGILLPSPEAEALDFLKTRLKTLTSGDFLGDPTALLDLIERRIANRVAPTGA